MSLTDLLAAIAGKRVTVMGLGLHGGGLATANFFCNRGARVTVTDLKTASDLASTVSALEDQPVRLTLGRHDEADFEEADLIIKNPGVPANSRFLELARNRGVPISSDIGVFLALTHNPMIAITGSKGKSTTASVAAHVLQGVDGRSRLGGNITVSPLTFVDTLASDTPVVLELSSWQLADLRGTNSLNPLVSVVTNILPDHMNYYASMDEYVADKRIIFEGQSGDHTAVFNGDDPWQREFAARTQASCFWFSHSKGTGPGGWLDGDRGLADVGGVEQEVLPPIVRLPGDHNRMNLLSAAVALRAFGVDARVIRDGLAGFPGIEHRIELCGESNGLTFYNDSAATIPHATRAALRALPAPIVLIAGGTDKNIDFSVLLDSIHLADRIYLLEGTGTEKLIPLLREKGAPYEGPYTTLESAVAEAVSEAPGGASILFSPGCTSFGMFQNEFHRGRQFKEIVRAIVGRS